MIHAMSGNCTFTVRSLKTQKRYTFKVSKPKQAHDDIRFVALLAGPDNESDYVYVGMITPSLEFRLTRASQMTLSSEPVIAFSYVWNFLSNEQPAPGVEIFYASRCARCGRKLTVPESVEAQYGPECIGKVGL